MRNNARSGRRLAQFQKANEERRRVFAYRLGSRGFYAELTTLARAMLYCLAHDMRLVIDSRAFGYRREHGWNDYFLPFCAELADHPDIEPDLDCHSDVRGPGTVFDELLAHRCDSITIGSDTVRGFDRILAALLTMIFRLNGETARAVSRLKEECGLPARYASIHVRRGDKVGDEDHHYPVELYLDRLEAQGAAGLPLFVMSDDHRSVLETQAALRQRGSSASVHSLCGERHRGFSIHDLRQERPAFPPQDAMAGGSISTFREHIGPETVHLLAETVIAIRSRCFVGTKRSNVGKSILWLHDRPDRCVLLTPDALRAAADGGAPVMRCSADAQPPPSPAVPQDMEIVRLDDRDFFLFLDIFVHWSGRKITAVAPCYGDDIDWTGHGVDLQDVVLRFDRHRVRGRYIPHRLDSWEPCVLFDFEDPALEAHLREHDTIAFTVSAGPHSKEFVLDTTPVRGHDVAISLIVRDCNQWLPYFLDYYLACLACDHVYLYDNRTRDAEGLQSVIRAYADRGQLTCIPWHYRWKNTADLKQIGQIPQQAHSLNKFGNCHWIGFFDYDEFLRIPGRSLKEFLTDYDPNRTDGLSFGLRWFMYKGPQALEEIGNPLLNFFDAKRDALDRRRQKLIVSPRNVRFLRIHWLEDGRQEMPVDDTDVYFHHYYLDPERFNQGKAEPDTARDDYMLGFAEPLIRAASARAAGSHAGIGRTARDGHRPRPVTAEQWIAHVLDAFEVAEAEGSGLSNEALNLPGMCGRRNRHFINALCAFEGCRYLEIGSYMGASLCAAMHRNAISAVAIDNWSQFGSPRDGFMAATAAHRGVCELEVIEQDCFTVDTAGLGPFDVFYYDGDHSADSQARAIEHFYGCLGERAVILIDDWNWPQVREGTYRAMATLDLPVIYEKEIILPDTLDVPSKPCRDTWWNGIYVMIVDKRAAPLSDSTRPRAIAQTPDRFLDRNSRIEVVIFSKDRACQLEALLRSMDRFFDHPHRTTVLYASSDREYQRGYDTLTDWYGAVAWEREIDFRTDLLCLIDEARERGARHIMFLVDDIVFTRSFTGERMLELLAEDEDVLALSLRLGDNIRECHTQDTITEPPEFLDGRRWAWRDAPRGYWDYPMSLDGNIYRLDDIAESLRRLVFDGPNALESQMYDWPIDRPLLACDPSPYLVNLAINLVQDRFDNPHGGIPTRYLNRKFLDQYVLDIEPFTGREFAACHIVPEVNFIQASRPARAAARFEPASTADRASKEALDRRRSRLNGDTVPVRRRFVRAHPDGNGLTVKRRLARKGFRLNGTGKAIWSLCDGQTSVAAMFEILARRFRGSRRSIRQDVITALTELEKCGMLALRNAPRQSRGSRKIDLREVPFYVINCKSDGSKRDHMQRQLSELGLRFEFVDATECKPNNVGTAISHLKILNRKDIATPFGVLEDDCEFNGNFRYEYMLPSDTDAYYLGVSRFGIEIPGELSWGKFNRVQWSRYDRYNLRVFNMLARHAILYLSDEFRQAALSAMLEAMMNYDGMYPGDVGLATTHLTHLVLTPNEPVCYQATVSGGQQIATERPLTEI